MVHMFIVYYWLFWRKIMIYYYKSCLIFVICFITIVILSQLIFVGFNLILCYVIFYDVIINVGNISANNKKWEDLHKISLLTFPILKGQILTT